MNGYASRTPKHMNGVSVHRLGSGTILIPLPRKMWRKIEGGPCQCAQCKESGARYSYWDTVAVATDPKGTDTTWTVHAPYLHREWVGV